MHVCIVYVSVFYVYFQCTFKTDKIVLILYKVVLIIFQYRMPLSLYTVFYVSLYFISVFNIRQGV